ncbi:hypothetical protein QJQ45_006645 [Haematococcus lacustris]|nr:hypothetical protein QJQ45_006645 [Haematococcus lacustris]
MLRGCKETKRKLKAHLQLRAGVHSQLRVILHIFLTCLVGYPTPGYRSAPTPPAVQPPQAPDAAPLSLLPMRAPAWPASMAMDWEPELEPEPEPEPAPTPPTLRPPSARLAARHPPPAAPTGPPMPLDSEDPLMLQHLQVFCMYFANSNFLTPYNQLQRRPGRLKPRGTDQRRGRVVLVDEHRTTRVTSAVNGQQPCERQLNKCRATRPADWKPPAGQVHHRLVRPAWSQQRDQPVWGMMWCPVVAPRKPPQAPRSSQEASQPAASEPGPSNPLPAKSSKPTKAEPAAEPSKGKGKAAKAKPAPQPGRFPGWRSVASTSGSRSDTVMLVQPCSSRSVAGASYTAGPVAAPSAATAAAHAVGLPRIGKGLAEQRDFVLDPATQSGVGIDPGVTQAVSAASGVWDVRSGQLAADQLQQWKLTKGQVKHGSGLNNACRATERWLAPIKPHLQHLAAASSAGTSLVANLKHITVTLATWDAVWEVYLDLKWAQQRLRLYGAQDRALEQFFKKLVVFFGAAGIGSKGGWGADVVLWACCKVVCRPRGTDQRRGRVVLVDEHRTTRVSSAVNGQQPCERQLNKCRATRPAGWKPPAGQVHRRLMRPAWSQQRDQPVRGMMWCPVVAPRKPPQAPGSSQAATQAAASEPGPSTPLPAKRSKRTKADTGNGTGKAQGKAAEVKPAPQPGRWVDRDCNAALNMQRIGESRWRPLELCYWPEQGKLPAKGKKYPGLGYKRLQDKPPKTQPVVAQ